MKDITAMTNLLLEGILKSGPNGIAILGIAEEEVKIIYANERFYKALGYHKNEAKEECGRLLSRLHLEKGSRIYQKVVAESLRGKDAVEEEVMVNHRDGKSVWLLSRVSLLENSKDMMCFYVTLSDITGMKLMQQQIRIEQERYGLLDHLEEEIPFEYNPYTDVLTITQKTAQKLGCNLEIPQFLGKEIYRDYVHGSDLLRIKKKARSILGEPHKGELDLKLRICGSEYQWYRIFYSSLADENGEIISVLGRAMDIQKMKSAVEQMEEKLRTDLVTGLGNEFASQLAVEDFLQQENMQHQQHSMLILRVDGMEEIFRCYGEIFGNAILQNLAETIRLNFRNTDIVGRISADEFMVFLKDVSETVASRKAEDLCYRIQSLYAGENHKLQLGCNIGMSYYPQNAKNFELLFSLADDALAYAMSRGKNSIAAYEAHMKHIKQKREAVRFEQEHRLREQYDMSLLSFGFSLLSNSRDMNSSINLLLERIGKRYDLSYVSIYEKDAENNCMISTNMWERSRGLGRTEHILAYVEEGANDCPEENRFFCIDDCEENAPDNYTKTIIREKNVKSIIGCGFSDQILGAGSIFFCDCKRKRKWTEMEKATLYEFGRMLSVFVFLRKERFRDKERITELLSRDQLTGLLNQKAFEKEVSARLKQWDGTFEYALAFTDIKNFEYVNSNFGYEAGNKMLVDYARVLQQIEGVEACCRLYSDYFMVLCRAGQKHELENHIRTGMDTFVNQQKELYPASNLWVSTGLYFLKHSKESYDFSVMMENANLARKQAKEQGDRLICIYQEALRQDREHEQEVAGSLHEAIRNHKIEVYLQPKFSLTRRVPIGAEALVRWRKEDGTLRAPAEFIPVLEKVGYVVELDFYVFEQVLANMKKWKAEGKQMLPISVNFSRCHIRHDDFVRRVCQMTEQYGIEKEYIEIEITENSINEDSGKMFRDMENLRNAGFKVHIDDFGTGYSSLNMLLKAPVDTVKVDKSFLQHIGESEKEMCYVNHLAHLIAAADKEIVFEGVETERQAKLLTDCGYTMAQGYLFGKPMPVSEYERIYLLNA